MNLPHKRSGGATMVGAIVSAVCVAAAIVFARHWPSPPAQIFTESQGSPIVFSTPGGLLEVAGIMTTEFFERRSIRSIAGVNLGTTVSQIRVPVTYRYQTELGKEWRAYVREGKFLVIAPAVKPSLPVAIDTANMHMQTQAGWARFNGNANLQALLQQITPVLHDKAHSAAYVELQREQARKTVTAFAQRWLITQEQWTTVKPDQIRVYFSDEPIGRLRTYGPEFAGSL